MRSGVLIFALAAAGTLAAKSPQYRLWLVNRAGTISETWSDFLSRKFVDIEVTALAERERYRKAPHYPVPVCPAEEYYLFSPGDELLAIGCVHPEFPALMVPEVTNAVKKYEADIKNGRNPTLLTARLRR